MRVVTPIWRGLRVAEHLLTGTVLALCVAILQRFRARPAWTTGVVRWWHERLCRAIGLHIEVSGRLQSNALLIANHVSWLDIPVIGARGHIAFLSKAEVRAWPLIGWMADIAGTLFIERGAHQSAEMAARIAGRVRTGKGVVIFPEGTTTDGRRLARFHPRLFAAAQHEGVRIQPIALRYGQGEIPDQVAPFVGDDALLPHLLRLLRHPGLHVRIVALPEGVVDNLDRRGLAEHSRSAIAETLHVPTAIPTRGARVTDREDLRTVTAPLGRAT